MSRKVVKKITAKHENVRKEVTSVMGGKVLEYEAKTILQDGIRKGKAEGKVDSILELLEELGEVPDELRLHIQKEVGCIDRVSEKGLSCKVCRGI